MDDGGVEDGAPLPMGGVAGAAPLPGSTIGRSTTPSDPSEVLKVLLPTFREAAPLPAKVHLVDATRLNPVATIKITMSQLTAVYIRGMAHMATTLLLFIACGALVRYMPILPLEVSVVWMVAATVSWKAVHTPSGLRDAFEQALWA